MAHSDRNRTVSKQERGWLRDLMDDSRVHPDVRDQFATMLDELETGIRQCLSHKQRDWVQAEHGRLELGAQVSTNDVSTGAVPAPKAPMDFSCMGPMVLAPPCRRVS